MSAPGRALAVAAFAILMFTAMDGTIKALPAGLSTLQIVALRFAFGVPPAALMAWRVSLGKGSPYFSWASRPLSASRKRMPGTS